MPSIAFSREIGTKGTIIQDHVSTLCNLRIITPNDFKKRQDASLRDRSDHLVQNQESLSKAFQNNFQSVRLYNKSFIQDLIHIATSENICIRGWGAPIILSKVSNVLCVHLFASIEYRAKHLDNYSRELVAKSKNTSIENIEYALKEIDKDTIGAHTMFGPTTDNALIFDLVLNVEKLGIQNCVDIIKDTFKTKFSIE